MNKQRVLASSSGKPVDIRRTITAKSDDGNVAYGNRRTLQFQRRYAE